MNWKSEWRRRKCQIDKQCTLYSNCKRCSFAIPLGEIEKTRYQIFTNRSPLTPLCWCNIWFSNFLLDILFPFNHSWDSLANRLIYLVDYTAIVLVMLGMQHAMQKMCSEWSKRRLKRISQWKNKCAVFAYKMPLK